MKTCSGCKLDKPLQDFSPLVSGKYGRAARCRPCSAADARARTAAKTADDRARQSARRRLYLQENPEQAARDRAASLRWARANRMHKAAVDAAWYRANSDAVRDRFVARREADPVAQQARMRAANQRREARLKGARINDFSAADWLVVLDEFNHACAYCLRRDVPLQREHMQPLAQGGDHTKSNIVPACGECNRRKHTKTLLQTLAS